MDHESIINFVYNVRVTGIKLRISSFKSPFDKEGLLSSCNKSPPGPLYKRGENCA